MSHMSTNKNITFPFSAIIGQEEMKKGLILNVIHPKIGGILVFGEKERQNLQQYVLWLVCYLRLKL